MEKESAEDSCIGAGSVAGAVIGTFLTTILLLAVAALLYRQWRRHKGKHLVLVTDPEIVEDAYAFDNPCFKDATLSQLGSSYEKPPGTSSVDTPAKHSPRWPTSWVLGSGNRSDKKRTLDDSCLGPKATKVNVVSLRSHDFTGLGFNVCGNMREGIFVKDLLHRGPASESGRIHPGDRIASVKISFRNMVYEDALTILSYASPYDVELEVESGVTGSKPTTLLKKSVGPSPTHICHPLYRSQSIPELTQAHRSVAKRLFIAEPNDVSVSSNYSTLNSTLKSSKSTPASQTVEKQQAEAKSNHQKFGIKVLPALDGALHRIENQNEHNTNLERRHSKKLEMEKKHLASLSIGESPDQQKVYSDRDNVQQLESPQFRTPRSANGTIGINPPDSSEKDRKKPDAQASIDIPSEVPTEVHNAAMAAQRNRRYSAELLNGQRTTSSSVTDTDGPKSPQKNKRKAPAPPKSSVNEDTNNSTERSPQANGSQANLQITDTSKDSPTDSISVCTEKNYVDVDSENDKIIKSKRQRTENSSDRRHSESDTDNEIQNSFTTIELNPADITIHRTPVPEANDDEDKEDDIYRKAASLGDLSKYECKTSATLERAQSLDMTDTGSKKRKAPLPPEDINESTEDLTKLDQIDTFDRRKLKKSNEWGTLEDVLWNTDMSEERPKNLRVRKKSNGTLERSKSAVEIKLKKEVPDTRKGNESWLEDDTSIELYNLPLSKRLTQDFLHSERNFDPNEDNSLARIVNDGRIVKSPTLEEIEMDFRRATPLPDEPDDTVPNIEDSEDQDYSLNQDFSKALRYFESQATRTPSSPEMAKLETKIESSDSKTVSYANKEPVIEEIATKVHIERGCRACGARHSQYAHCEKSQSPLKRPLEVSHSTSYPVNQKQVERSSTPVHLRAYPTKSDPVEIKRMDTTYDEEDDNSIHARRTKHQDAASPTKSKSSYQRVITNTSKKLDHEKDDDEDEYEFGSTVTVNSKNLSDREERHNANNVSVSSGENSEDSGLVGESMSMDYNPHGFESRPPLPTTPMPQKMTYITEIEVPSSRESKQDSENESAEILYIMGATDKAASVQAKVTSNGKPATGKKPPVPPRRSDIVKAAREDNTGKQVLYVSEYKTPASKESEQSSLNQEEKSLDAGVDKFGDQSRWINSSGSPQSVTNIVLTAADEKVFHQ